MDMEFILNAKKEAIEWARKLVERDPNTCIILDTETTGLGPRDEVVQIGVVDGAGKVLIKNQLINPGCNISKGAYEVHGISHMSVESAPSFHEFVDKLADVMRGKLVVIYNADYDTRMLVQSDRKNELKINEIVEDVNCAMLEYAKFFGGWDDYHESFRWQKLPAGDHSAVGDCLATLKIIKEMAEGD